jgi:hypothetical protein
MPRIALVAEGLRALAEEKGVAFVDGHAIFLGDGYPAGYFGGDLLHFSSAGHLALAGAINPALESALITTPVPAALPLFASAFAVLCLAAWRRRGASPAGAPADWPERSITARVPPSRIRFLSAGAPPMGEGAAGARKKL